MVEPDEDGITLSVGMGFIPRKKDAAFKDHVFGKHWWAFMGANREVVCIECGAKGSMEQVKDVGADEMSHQSQESLSVYDAFRELDH